MELTRIHVLFGRHNLMEHVFERRLAIPEARRHAHDNGHLIQELCLIVLIRTLGGIPQLLQSWMGCRARKPQLLNGLDRQILDSIILVEHPQHKLCTNVSAALNVIGNSIEGPKELDHTLANAQSGVLQIVRIFRIGKMIRHTAIRSAIF
jgi:hypothetical protein